MLPAEQGGITMNLSRHCMFGVVFSALILFPAVTAIAGTSWTAMPNPIFYGNWAHVAVSDFNTDGIPDVIAANPEADPQISPASGLPVWFGWANQSGNGWTWGLSSNGGITGNTPSIPYPDADSPPVSLPHIWRIFNGNPGNIMSEWTFEIVDKPKIKSVQVVHGSTQYTVTKVGEWKDYFHHQIQNWQFNVHSQQTGIWATVTCDYFGNQELDVLHFDETWSSRKGEISINAHYNQIPADGDLFIVTTQPATYTVTSSAGFPALNIDGTNRPIYMGEYCQDVLYRYAVKLDPGWIPAEIVSPGEKWHFYSPGGPRTSNSYLWCDAADFDRDGQVDIVGCGPNGLDVFLQGGPQSSNMGFRVGPHNLNEADGWTPGGIAFTVNAFPASTVKNEVWTFEHQGTSGIWRIYGEYSGEQPQFNQYDPDSWEGTACRQFGNLQITGQYGPGDVYNFSTYRTSWTSNIGPNSSDGFICLDVGDINHDGRVDIIAAKDTGGFVIYKNEENPDTKDGSNKSINWVNLPVPNFAQIANEVKLCDINKDGYLDIVAASENSGIWAWLGLSNGTWSANIGPDSAEHAAALTLGDFNRDGNIDVAAANARKGINIYYLRSDGSWFQRANATLPQPDGHNVGNGSVSSVRVSNITTVTDFWTLTCDQASPGAGRFQVWGDVAGMQSQPAIVGQPYVSDNGEVDFTIYSGDVDFTVGDKFTFTTGRGPLTYRRYTSLDTADLDNDGNLDLFAANGEDEGINVWRGNGVYGWTPETSPQNTNSWSSISAETDLNFDGNPDVVASCSNEEGVSVWVGEDIDKFNWSGWLHIPVASGRYEKIAHADFNNDNRIDLVAANMETGEDGIRIWEGDGVGGFTEKNGPTRTSNYYSVAVADFNLDGFADVAAGHISDGFDVWMNRGNWTWSEQSTSSVNQDSFNDLAIGDINNDGYPDIIAAKTYAAGRPGVIVYYNHKIGNSDYGYFDMSEGNYLAVDSAIYNYWGVDVADFNQDGYLDIIATKPSGNPGIIVYYSEFDEENNLTYDLNSFFSVDPSGLDEYYGIATTDFNLDSIPDFVAAGNGQGGRVGFGLGNDLWICHFIQNWLFEGTLRDVAVCDLTNDGTPDVAMATYGNGIQVWKSRISTSTGYSSFQRMESPTTEGSYIGVDIVDVNNDGMPDVIGASEGGVASGVNVWISRREDIIPVKVVDTFPENNGTFEVQGGTPIHVRFSEPVDPATITYDNIQLKKGEILVAYSLISSGDNTEINIYPISLDRDTDYSLFIRGGSEGLRDQSGNQFDGNGNSVPEESPTDDYNLYFTTVDNLPPSIPSGITAQPIDHGFILTWSSNSDPILDSDLEGYWVSYTYNPDSSDFTDFFETYYLKEELGDPPVITMRGLDNDRRVYVALVSQDATKNISNYSNFIPVDPEGLKPEIWFGGMYSSYITQDSGGTLTMIAYVIDPQNDIDRVQVYYAGTPIDLYLYDDGQHGDFSPNDSLYAFTVPLGPGDLPRGLYQLDLVAVDKEGHRSFTWPYLSILDDRPGESLPDTFHRYFRHQEAEFLQSTRIDFEAFGRTPSPGGPQILAAGYQSNPVGNFEFGPTHCLTAVVTDPDGPDDIANVQLYYGGIPLGWFMVDDGTCEDFNPDDSLYGYNLTMPGKWLPPGGESMLNPDFYLPVGDYTFEIRATDKEGNISDLWPYVNSN